MSSMSPQVHKSPSTICDTVLCDECNLDNSTLAPTSSLPQPVDHSFEDESYFGILVAPQSHTHGDRYSQNKETTQDSKPGTFIASNTIDSTDTREEDCHGISTAMEMSLITAEPLCTDRGSGDGQIRVAGHRADRDLLIPKRVPSAAIEPWSMVCRDGSIGSKEVPSVKPFQGASNFEIKDTNIITTGGNATFIQFGDGQFTEIQRNLIGDYRRNLTALPDINHNFKQHILTQSIISLPRAEAAFSDYQTKKKSGPCFEGTRVTLLQEMVDWITGSDESRMYVLSGLAGIGKSTVAYTIASRSSDLNLLGASFFFSRDEDYRKNAKRFFTTIAYQLCVYNEAFAKAIGDVLLTEHGSAATSKDPREQLQVLILEPLQTIVQPRTQPILVVVDALDECDEDDEHAVVMGLIQLVQLLPSFKVILTTRPQPLVDYLFGNCDSCNVFHLQDIEGKVVDDDIRLYLSHSFSQEQVRAHLPNPKEDWYASDEDIESLVKAAGRLFIVASTAVLYVLNKTLGNPGAQMKKLLGEIAQDRTPFHALNDFYSVIVCGAIQVDDDVSDTIERYRSIVGAIVVIQTPLPVTALASLVGEEAKYIYGMLRNLQSVILLGGDDTPRVYHKSFTDYLTDPTCCKDPHLQIDTRIHHTQIAIRCFEIMNKHLKYNILSLGNPARFMNNKDGLEDDGVTDGQQDEKIPQQLRYACIYWDDHLGVSNLENVDLVNALERFVNEHLLHWLEVLSLIGKLDLAYRAISVVLKLVQSTSLADLHQLLSDALCFISKFYETIKQSALHTYYSALAFTPTDSLLYRRYNKETVDNICVIEGGPEKWDALVAGLSHGEPVDVIKFSLDSSLFVSWSEKFASKFINKQGRLKIWTATTGTLISMIQGRRFAIASDFSTVTSYENSVISCYNVNESEWGAVFTTSSEVVTLTFSNSGQIAAALKDGTVSLWEIKGAGLTHVFDEFKGSKSKVRLQFSPTGTRLVYLSWESSVIKLRDGVSGRFIADLQCGSLSQFYFSGDDSRIASLSWDGHLRLWNSESGTLISKADVGYCYLAISANGSLLATADRCNVTLWSDKLTQIEVLELNRPRLITFSVDNILAIATLSGIELYDIKIRSFISTLPFKGWPQLLTFSPDCTRLAVADDIGEVHLLDIRGMNASGTLSKERPKALTALTLSRDCSRLACGFEDGTVELWETDPTTGTKQRIRPFGLRSKIMAFLSRIFDLFHHNWKVTKVGISPDGKWLASGSYGTTIKLWNGKDGSLRAILKVPSGGLRDLALSNSMLIAAWGRWGTVTLWDLDTLSPIFTEDFGSAFTDSTVSTVSIAENSAFVAIAVANTHPFKHYCVFLLDVKEKSIITTFDVLYRIHAMIFLPDNSHLVVQSDEGIILSFNLDDKSITEGPTLEYLIQLSDTPLRCWVPIWHCKDSKGQHYFSALFPQHKNPVPVLWIPRQISVAAWTQGSCMAALGCNDGHVILLRLPIRRAAMSGDYHQYLH